MNNNKLPVRFTGQHFTIHKELITDAISVAKIEANDIVLDIGAGKGFLTHSLADQCATIIAIENDELLLAILRKKFTHNPSVKIVDCDFRDFTIPRENFKVVSNIPFSITSYILKSLMYNHAEYFLGGALIMQLEPARKLFSEKVYNPYIVLYHTFFNLKLVYEIAPESFQPPPKVKSVLLRIERKKTSMSCGMKEKYLGFLRYLLQKPDLTVKIVLKLLFRKSQVREIAVKHGIDLDCKVVLLSAEQWAGCFLEMLHKVPEKFHPT